MKSKNLKRNKKFLRWLFYFLTLLFCFSLAKVANAASLYLSPSSGSYSVGEIFSVSVYVSSPDQAINAASGIISFPLDKLEVVSLSKAGSIFNLWIQEPSFSNANGTINFEGIVLNPGFIGSNGKILTINFKAKGAGIAFLNFSSGSVLANDGQGTNILKSLKNATFSLGISTPSIPESQTPSTKRNTPLAPKIFSSTHPDPSKWYAKNTANFSWSLPSGTTAVRLLVGKNPSSLPTVYYKPPISSKEIKNLTDGVWYFHVQLQNKFGWGEISHFKFQIDTQPPKPFNIEIKEGKKTTNFRPTIIFNTDDETSGIDYYEIMINGEVAIKTEKTEYKTPLLSLGKHTIIVKAVDKAGNFTLAITELEILPIEAPIITDYPKELLPNSFLSIKGKSVPEATINIFIQNEKGEMKIEKVKSNKDGDWEFLNPKPLEKGVYQVWAQAQDPSGAKSSDSEKVSILVNPPPFMRIGKLVIDYLATIVTLLVLLLAIILIIFYFWQITKKRKRKIQKETVEAEKILRQAFKTLKEEIENQIKELDGKPDLNEREKEICERLKNALNIAEKCIKKEIKDIKKEIK